MYYQGVIKIRLVTCYLPRVHSLTSLITQIQWECLVQVKVYSQRPVIFFYSNKIIGPNNRLIIFMSVAVRNCDFLGTYIFMLIASSIRAIVAIFLIHFSLEACKKF